ncbi:hypothetical protein QQZ08_002999 [Neonectria magnoliae]|uniref:Uncharacterized protein n=1 Tax=Neonectria magnoliae TaxID=2732573 RepID=A0ABR1IAJ2_9HYPO
MCRKVLPQPYRQSGSLMTILRNSSRSVLVRGSESVWLSLLEFSSAVESGLSRLTVIIKRIGARAHFQELSNDMVMSESDGDVKGCTTPNVFLGK